MPNGNVLATLAILLILVSSLVAAITGNAIFSWITAGLALYVVVYGATSSSD